MRCSHRAPSPDWLIDVMEVQLNRLFHPFAAALAMAAAFPRNILADKQGGRLVQYCYWVWRPFKMGNFYTSSTLRGEGSACAQWIKATPAARQGAL